MCFYTLAMNNSKKMKLRKQSHLQQNQEYLRINLTKKVKDLYLKNYKTWPKEIKDNLNKENDTSCSWIGRLNIKMTELPKVLY